MRNNRYNTKKRPQWKAEVKSECPPKPISSWRLMAIDGSDTAELPMGLAWTASSRPPSACGEELL